VSFFDDGDPPTRARSSPRPPARPRQPSGSGRPSSHAPASADELRNRRIGLIGGGIVLVLILGFLINSCMNSAKNRSMKSYNSQVTALVKKSDDNSSQLFQSLSGGSEDDQTVAVNQIRLEAEDVAKRAAALDVPDEMKPAQRNLLLALDLRAAAIGKIGEQLTAANGNDASAYKAMQKIAGQMRAFLASDVIYSQRVQPLINDAFDDAGITGQIIAPSQFLESDGWLSTNKVADRINPSAASPSRTGAAPAPGTHGHGIVSTKIGTTTLSPTASTRVPLAAGAKPTVDVTFANQGENDETDVVVTMKLTSGGGNPQTIKKRVNVTKKGSETTSSIAFTTAPSAGQVVQIAITIAKVPGETNTANNKATYDVLFTGG
jgi:hypothetical protein